MKTSFQKKKIGTVLALLDRQKTGKGQQIEASLFATSVAYNAPLIVEQSN